MTHHTSTLQIDTISKFKTNSSDDTLIDNRVKQLSRHNISTINFLMAGDKVLTTVLLISGLLVLILEVHAQEENVRKQYQEFFKMPPHTGSNNIQPRMRERRFLPFFTVVQFPNQDCKAMTGDNGTCMSQYECKASGGISSGICANNFGVCCLSMVTCGQTSNRNGSYFVNKNYPAPNDETGSCQITLRKAHPDVCQYRIDFVQFSLMGPEQVNHLCNSDQFLVSGSSPVPPICGKNTGSHIYVDAGDLGLPVMLTVITSGASFSRTWKMRISQISCNSNMKAEDGCLQYYSGISGQIKSFNYEPNSGLQLSNQDYTMCIRSERNFCSIQYSACPDLVNNRTHSFTLTSNTLGQNPVPSNVGSSCNSDFLIIPCVSSQSRNCVDRICGGTMSVDSTTNEAVLTSNVKPFRISFHSNNVEAPNDMGNRGFCIEYVQQPCTNNLVQYVSSNNNY